MRCTHARRRKLVSRLEDLGASEDEVMGSELELERTPGYKLYYGTVTSGEKREMREFMRSGISKLYIVAFSIRTYSGICFREGKVQN